MNSLLGVIAVFLLLPMAVLAADSGQLPWVVWQFDLRNFSSVNNKILADFESEKEADEFAKEQTAHDDLVLQIKFRFNVSPPIVDPPVLPPFLDPVCYSLFDLDPVTSYLEGRSGFGRVGEQAVRIEFHRGNKFLFTEGLTGDGTWEETESGEVLLTTENTQYRGFIDRRYVYTFRFYQPRNTITGLSWTNDDLEPLQEFRFTLGRKSRIAGKLYYRASSDW